jgi:hypothetical protein
MVVESIEEHNISLDATTTSNCSINASTSNQLMHGVSIQIPLISSTRSWKRFHLTSGRFQATGAPMAKILRLHLSTQCALREI